MNLKGEHLTALHEIKGYVKGSIVTQCISHSSITAMHVYNFCGRYGPSKLKCKGKIKDRPDFRKKKKTAKTKQIRNDKIMTNLVKKLRNPMLTITLKSKRIQGVSQFSDAGSNPPISENSSLEENNVPNWQLTSHVYQLSFCH